MDSPQILPRLSIFPRGDRASSFLQLPGAVLPWTKLLAMLRCWVEATCLVPALRGSGDRTRHPFEHNLEGLCGLRRAAEEALFHGREKQCGPHLLARRVVNSWAAIHKGVATYPSAGGRRVTRGMRVPRKEYARSRHQRLFEENVGKTGKDAIYELLSERFGSCIYARGRY